MKHRMRWASVWLAFVLALAPMAVSAQDEVGTSTDPTAEFNKGKFFDLAVCVVSIAAIETGVGATMAVVSCTRAAVTWWSE
jgi:hypothetical protein